ncbi:MAG: long-chain fatty acid--CoA ligase [Thiomicrorhabdus sp.]|jgi:long-chain acyl-CoA synthetase|nr:long-chain fatty acid--CoA ligase [Thiomicrorhabdus sp.]
MDHPWFKFYDRTVEHSLIYPEIPVYDLLDDTARKYPRRPVTRFMGKQINYASLKLSSDNLAAALQQLGIGSNDKVVLLLPNFPGFLIAYYALLKVGAVVVPLNPLHTEPELEFMFNDAEAETAITIPMFLPKVIALQKTTRLKQILVSFIADFLPFPLNLVQKKREAKLVKEARSKAKIELLTLQSLVQRSASVTFKPSVLDSRQLAVLIYSGGTTGVAKGIMLSHYSIVANAHQVVAWGGLAKEDRILAVLPLFHGFGMSVCMNSSVLVGMEIVLLPKFSASDMAKTIHKYRPTLTAAVPTILVALSNLINVDKYDFSSLKVVWVGAAALTDGIKNTFEKKTGGRTIEGYGLTETVTAIMANPYQGQHKVGSVGLPFPDVKVRIISLDGNRELPAGEPGEIILKTPTMMMGYYNRPEETDDAIIDGWLQTGDIGYLDEDGYLYITDRKKDLIIVDGFNVFPREIDELIYQHPKVKEGLSVGIPDHYKGEMIKVYIILKAGQEATSDEFKQYFRKHLTPYKVPSEIEFRSELPKSAIGKILRRALRDEEIEKLKSREA